jgi:ribosomal protein S14
MFAAGRYLRPEARVKGLFSIRYLRQNPGPKLTRTNTGDSSSGTGADKPHCKAYHQYLYGCRRCFRTLAGTGFPAKVIKKDERNEDEAG